MKPYQRVHVTSVKIVLAVLREIREGGYPNKARLAELTGKHPRSIQRLLNSLRKELRAPIGFDRKQNGFYLTDAAWRLDGKEKERG